MSLFNSEIENQVRDHLVQILEREPTEEEIDIEIKDISKEEEMTEFTIGLYRRFSNKNLQKAIEKNNFTAKKIQEKTRIYSTRLSRIINFRERPTEDEKIKLAILLETPVDDIFPEKYDEAFERLSPLRRKAEVEYKYIPLESKEVFQLEDPNREREIEKLDARILWEKIKKDIEKGLSPRLYATLRYRFGLDGEAPHTLSEAAQYLGVTRERVRQIEAKALEKIRKKNYAKQGNKI